MGSSVMESQSSTSDVPIAIIGSGCRFPGNADTPSKLWDLLHTPRDVSSPLPPSRFNAAGFYHKDGSYHGHTNVKDMRGYFLSEEGVERRFDAGFFGINHAEANVLDPQMRLLLEVSYEALEAAGQTIEGLQGSDTGCYVGLMGGEYEQAMMRDPETLGTYHVTGTARSFLSNRLSYFFDWHGPSMTIDTACSSSLVAVHQGVQLLRSGQSRVAVAAGSNMIMDPSNYISETKLQLLSPDGQSRMWDASGNGYARGEGVCTIIMKRLSDALVDGDHIECVIRETGINSDGRTKGITRPSSAAQAALIRDTYRRAGLDPSRPADRPQYFEAHGTGTAAGDPIEAEAIHSAFFGSSSSDRTRGDTDPLWVGSIKTICGHTEGTAGLAGILKASLALQKSIVPPNLLFNTLNPGIKPFTDHLRIPTGSWPWPPTETGQPRRASVNSFGFGGTNAHAILESVEGYTQGGSDLLLGPTDVPAPVFTPFIFSAASEKSLRNYIKSFVMHLESNVNHIHPRNLAYTLHARRSRFQYATAVAARDGAELLSKLKETLRASEADAKPVGIRASLDASQPRGRPVVFGIFTGQGAQWASMGSELLSKSPAAAEILARLESRLAQLPVPDRPTWSLREELQRVDASRVGEAQFSQPLCTAIQIILVELMRSAGLEFSAVVGHSSGEIAAAFAAGLISAEDAICIAYYRGLHTKLAGSNNGQKGAMMAVGTSFEDASEILESDKFKGNVNIAAVNSASSVTLSGDEDAIQELKVIFEDEEKLARILKVEKAYHSHHMVPCTEVHRESLRALDIKVSHEAAAKCTWVSSCYGQEVTAETLDKLRADYWVDNLLNPVLFMQAVQKTCSLLGPCHLAVEIGPHPALRGPALQTIQDATGQQEPVPYTGLLKRGAGDNASVADGLGYACSRLGRPSLDLQAYDQFVSGNAPSRLDKTVPLYSWDHDTDYWHDSRFSRAYHMRSKPHELLGHLAPDCVAGELRWRQILSPKEIPWLNGHRLQGQAVFPAAGYIVLAIEACREMLKIFPDSKRVSLIQVHDINISQAMTFNDDNAKVEAVFCLHNITHEQGSTTAQFQCSGASVGTGSAQTTGDLSLRTMASGFVQITTGQPSPTSLPARGPRPDNVLPVRTEDLYDSLQHMEYGYTGPFYALRGLERRLGAVRGQVMSPDDPDSELLIHPAMLDAAFQSVLLAQAAPYDGKLWSIHVPRTIQRVTVNPILCEANMIRGKLLRLDACQPTQSARIRGDVDVYPASEELSHAMIQVEGLDCVPFAPATAQDDREILSIVEWGPAFPDAAKASYDLNPTREQTELSQLLDRLSFFYLQHLQRSIPHDDTCRRDGPISGIFAFADHIESLIRSGDRPFWKPEWHHDTHETIAEASEPYDDIVDVRLLKRVGENLIDIAKGTMTAIEVTMRDQLLNETYTTALGLKEVTDYVARVVSQIMHRYPHLNVLEVGGGTGGATKAIFGMADGFSSYTFTDVSSAFFSTAQRVFEAQSSRMTYKMLDVGKDPIEQGFSPQAYDLIVASMVLHATPVLRQTLRNVRRLLKPGGYLVIQEGFCNDVGRSGTIFGAFPDWWLGADEGRVLGPLVSLAEWDELLRDTGFSGCDTSSPTTHPLSHPTAVFVSQAVDDRVNYIRDPLSVSSPQSLKLGPGTEPGTGSRDLVLVGGKTLDTYQLISQLKGILQKHFSSVAQFDSFADLAVRGLEISATTTMLSLSELDEPLLQNPNEIDFEAIKKVLQSLGSILWVTRGRRAKNPFTNMTVGLVRGVVCEVPTLTSQFLDFEDANDLDIRAIANALLRFRAQAAWAGQHHGDGPNYMLDGLEREIVLDAHGQMLIPRLKPSKDMNERYNSSRRSIYNTVAIGQGSKVVSMRRDEDSEEYRLEEQHDYDTELSTTPTRQTQVTLTHSLISAVGVRKDFGYSHISLGRDHDTGHLQVVLSTQLSPTVHPLESLGLTHEIKNDSKAHFLRLITLSLVAIETLSSLSPGVHLIVYEPEPAFAAMLLAEAKDRHVDVTVMGSKPQHNFTAGPHVHINPRAPDRVIDSLLPKHTSVFINCEEQTGSNSIADRIIALRATWYKVVSLTQYFAMVPSIPENARVGDLRKRLATAARHAEEYITRPTESGSHVDVRIVPVNSLAELARKGHGEVERTVVEWEGITEAPVKVRRIDSHKLFSDNKTYWLAGLSGGLGLSLCEWMIGRGAKFIVITSRRPNVAASWVEKMATLGAVVKIFPNDLTNRDQTETLYHDICSTMPPLGGVAQGAMVLQDTGFRDMTYDAMQKVLRPKVQGSIHLDTLLRDTDLEFFVFFSSATAIIGNAGQSNYIAANMFMTSLAEQRRQRGLAASVIHIGPILGVGYVSQKGEEVRDIFVRQGEYTFLSEEDFHQYFAEAVVAGRPGSRLPLEIAMGIAKVNSNPSKTLAWFANPMAAHMIGSATAEVASKTSESRASAKALLATAKTMEEVTKVLKDAFLPVICSLFQLGTAAIDSPDSHFLDSRLDEFGLDSLLAVEIRTWWLKTLQVNIPVMKILSGVTVRELIAFGVEGLSPDLVPNIKDSTAQDEVPSIVTDSTDQEAASPRLSDPSDGSEDDSTRATTAADNTTSSKSRSSEQGLQALCMTDNSDSDFDQLSVVARSMELSFNQRMFWFSLISLDDKTGLNHTASYRLTGKLRTRDLEQAVLYLGQRHEVLRTCFQAATSDGQPRQGILYDSMLRLEQRRISSEADADAVVQELQTYPYDVERGEAMRIVLLSLSATSHFLVTGAHSLVLDGVSSIILLRQLMQLYDNPSALNDGDIYQYFDFTRSQLEAFKAGELDEGLRFWRDGWSVCPPPLPILRLSSAVSRPLLRNYDNFSADAHIDPATKSRIWSVCRRNGVRPFHFFLTAFRALLTRLADADEVAIGIGDANRPQQGAMASLGPYVNMVPLRFDNSPLQNFEGVLRDSLDKATAALTNSHIPFQLLLTELGITRSATHTPIFQVFFDYRQGMRKKQQIGDCELELLSFQASKVPYDICLDIIDDAGDGGCLLNVIVRKDLYSQQDAQSLAKCVANLVESFSISPNVAFGEAGMFEEREVDRALEFGQGLFLPSQCQPETIIGRIRDVAVAQPDAPALKLTGGKYKSVSYREMMDKSQAIAAALQAHGCTKGSIVATYQERTPDWISSILGIMSIGGVCLPLDVGMPATRLAAMVEHSRPSILVDQDGHPEGARQAQAATLLEACNACGTQMMSVSEVVVGEKLQADLCASIDVGAEDTAMILYTSGSTGVPKGIVLKHGGFRNWVESAQRIFGMGDEETVLQHASCSFDMCFLQVFFTLCFGGALCLVPTDARADAAAMTEIIAAERITVTGATPSEYTNWLRYGNRESLTRSLSHWHTAFTGGEPTPPALLELFASLGESGHMSKGPRFINLYGPTEITFSATGTEIDYSGRRELKAPIGAGGPLANYLVYVMDEHLRPVPPGFQGEIVVGGAGIAAGYLGNPKLTDEKFVVNPLAPREYQAKGWVTMHRTGDVGRWREDGSLVIEGRRSGDTQIKLRGLRIDLAEVENTMLREAKGMLDQVVVSIRRASTSPQSAEFLVAHVKFNPDKCPPESEQQAFLNALSSSLPLPQYMWPAAAAAVQELPMMVSGKLDRKAVAALPLAEETILSESNHHDGTEKLTESEARLKSLWENCISKDVTKQHRITAETDFFHTGGNSLLLLKLQEEIRKAFGVRIQVVHMFESSTLGAMARRIGNMNSRQLESETGVCWEAEADIPEAIMMSLPAAAEVASTLPRVVVLTGATGFLGQSYLRALVADPNIDTIHCIAVRSTSLRTKQLLSRPEPLLRHPKVVLHEGDLTLPRLGLDEASSNRVLGEADCIIHNGADTSHLKTFQSLRKVNLQATKELVGLCLSRDVLRKIPIHYVSTASVLSFSGLDEVGEVSVAAYPPSSDGVYGYGSSKWASERFLEKVHEQSGSSWPIWIHRPSSVQPDADADTDAAEVMPHLDITQTLLKYCRLTNAVPVSPNFRGVVNQVPLGRVVESMMRELYDTSARAGGLVRYIHESGDVDIPLTQMKAFVDGAGQTEAGTETEGAAELPPHEWATRAAALGLDQMLVTLFRSVVDGRPVTFPSLAKGS